MQESESKNARAREQERWKERERARERARVRLSVYTLAGLFMTPFFSAEPDPEDMTKNETLPDKQPAPSGNSLCA